MIKYIFIAIFSISAVSAKSIQIVSPTEIDDVEESFIQECSDNNNSIECGCLRSQLMLELSDQLQLLERQKDIENIDLALKSLAVSDRSVQFHALVVLGPWASQNGVDDHVYPFLTSEIPLLENYAAKILRYSNNSKYVQLAEQYLNGHTVSNPQNTESQFLYSSFNISDDFKEQFSLYPSSKHFSVADYDTRDFVGIGFISNNPISQILSFYDQSTNVVALNIQDKEKQWAELYTAGEQTVFFGPIAKQIQELQKKFEETQDLSLIPQIEKLANEFEVLSQTLLTPGLYAINPPNRDDNNSLVESARWYFLKPVNDRPSKLVFIYFDPLLQQTVIQLIKKRN